MSLRHLLAFLFAGIAGVRAEAGAPLRAEVDTRALALPAVGDCSLQVLTPALLEFTQVSDVGSGAPVLPEATVTEEGRALAATVAGAKRRVAYAPLRRRDLRIATSYYIRLATPIDFQGAPRRIEVRLSWAGAEAGGQASAEADPLRLSPAIHVNEEGYVPSFPKKAMVGMYLGDLGEMEAPEPARFEIIDARDGRSVYSGELHPRRDSGFGARPKPYQAVLEADFSDFTEPGEYRLLVPGLGASLPFLVNDGIAMGFARTYALGLYHQRCGAPNALPYTRFVHAACHTAPALVPRQADRRFAFTWATVARYASEPGADNPPQSAPPLTSEAAQLYPFVNRGPVDVTGGHHDAGDYSKYTINSAELVHYLVFAVDSIPGVAALDNLGIPESGDGIPDVLEEAKHESDFLSKLQDADGGFYFLVYPIDREYESDVPPDHGDRQVVWPKNTAATAAAVAALAQCASSPAFKRHYPADAARYLAQAQLGWRFLMAAIARHGMAGAYQKITFYGDRYTHDDELAWAACELFLATGDDKYQQKLMEWFPNPADRSTFRWGWWRMSESWGNTIRSYCFAARSGRLAPASLDARYLRLCEGEVVAAGDDALSWSRASAYATPFPTPTKAVNGGGWYFSLDQASDMAVAYQIEPKPDYIDALVGAMNYEAGCNPVNVAFLAGIGSRRQREVVDQYSQNSRRTLPPSGIPIGNIQAGFEYLTNYGAALRNASYPADDAASAPFPIYDRWSDAYNVTTEFIAVNQARSLMAAAFLASRTPAASRAWSHAEAQIAEAPAAAGVELRLVVPGEDIALARTVWEARGQQPAFGPTFTLTPGQSGPLWVEAEAEWPDGRRAFATRTLNADSPVIAWVHGAIPEGATPSATGGDAWKWVTSGPRPRSGVPSHQSILSPGLHEQVFTGATATLPVRDGDTLYAWVYVDAAHPPSEIMLAWNDGASWEHRAYWGTDTITYGRDGTAGRHYAGPLPRPGRWATLRVRAADVGLSGSTVSGMSFSLEGGRAAWDDSGRSR